jgi:hypothetical protein
MLGIREMYHEFDDDAAEQAVDRAHEAAGEYRKHI